MNHKLLIKNCWVCCLLITGILISLTLIPACAWAQDVIEHVQVTVTEANIRDGPGTGHDVITTVKFDTVLPVLGIINRWIQIELTDEISPEAEVGFIHDSIVEPIEIIATQNPVETSENLPQTNDVNRPDDPLKEEILSRRMTFYTGLGNSFGWYGGQGEFYLSEGRYSVFLGLGYISSSFPFSGGAVYAIGSRVYFNNLYKRFFGEVNYSLLLYEGIFLGEDNYYYGPGFQIGYQFLGDGEATIMNFIIPEGLTFLISAGFGFANLPERITESSNQFLLGLAVGYTID